MHFVCAFSTLRFFFCCLHFIFHSLFYFYLGRNKIENEWMKWNEGKEQRRESIHTHKMHWFLPYFHVYAFIMSVHFFLYATMQFYLSNTLYEYIWNQKQFYYLDRSKTVLISKYSQCILRWTVSFLYCILLRTNERTSERANINTFWAYVFNTMIFFYRLHFNLKGKTRTCRLCWLRSTHVPMFPNTVYARG